MSSPFDKPAARWRDPAEGLGSLVVEDGAELGLELCDGHVLGRHGAHRSVVVVDALVEPLDLVIGPIDHEDRERLSGVPGSTSRAPPRAGRVQHL
jgi:hypothetical protein